ncbi:MAG TPA: tripartite tricarboxylate transporter permease [Terrimesophilobacter sp.]|nr:tripartite tricarboxylate transporter permease [Terrimesophilobacter sp.]HRP98883.1 tripartite tricarboxylate transporter permease [Terrimesophilobacter sp.]
MDVWNNLLLGFSNALAPQYLLLALIGVILGTLVGVLPGLGPATTVAMLLPLTFLFEPIGAFVMFAGVYYGAMYGGSTTAILLNIPGETASVPTTFEGHTMAKRGRGGAALATAAIGSFVAGTISTIAITVSASALASLAKLIQPAEYFAIMVLAFVTVSAILGASVARGLGSLSIGLAIGLIGIDSLTGQARYAFGIAELYDGIAIVTIAVGIFAIGEALYNLIAGRSTNKLVSVKGRVWMTRDEFSRSWRPWLRGTALGFPIGALPAGGAEIPTFLSYTIERRLSKRRGAKDEFGRGAIEGVAGPEAANNAAFSGVLVPLLTLGIPTSATAGILLIAFQIYSIQPGPLLFDTQPVLVWTIIASLYIGNVMLLILNLPMIKLWVKLLTVPREVLTACILVFAILGVFAATRNPTEVLIALAFGVIGVLLRLAEFPIAPLILGALLGPLMELHLRRALTLSGGDFSVLFTRPISVTILALSVAALVAPVVWRRIKSRRHGTTRF